jgi:integrase
MPAAIRKVALTDRSVQGLKPALAGSRTVVWDALLPGLAVRVSGKGKRSFYAVRRRTGAQQPSWVLLGAYPAMTLAEARAAAREALGALLEGHDPATLALAKGHAKEEAERRSEAGKFCAVAEHFIKQHLPRLRTSRAAEALIRRELIPVLGDKPMGEIRRRDVIALLEAIVVRGETAQGRARPRSGGEYAARHALAQLRKIFNWALSRDIEGLEANPCGRVKEGDLLGASKARDRVLTDAELRIVWAAAQATSYPFGPLVRGLLLTGQRLSEIAKARLSEIDVGGTVLMIPAERMKGKSVHVVPLTDRMSELLAELPSFSGGDFLFTTTAGRRPISGFSKMKRRFDKTVAELGPVAHWTLHDLRRTARTGMAAAGVEVFFAELVIGHRQGGVHRVYDLHRYEAEKREALERWERRLFGIVESEPEPAAPIVARMPIRARA